MKKKRMNLELGKAKHDLLLFETALKHILQHLNPTEGPTEKQYHYLCTPVKRL